MFSKVISGNDPARTTRFHTEQNERVDLAELIVDLPKCLYHKIFFNKGKRRASPWWPTRVIPKVEAFLKPSHDVIEYGSGSSTIWLARRARSVVSMEENQTWLEMTRARISREGIENAQIHWGEGPSYYTPPKETGPFDLAIVDGAYRWKCIETVLPKMKPGGMIYLDNADSDKDFRLYDNAKPVRRAQSLMEDYAKTHQGARLEKVKSIIDGELFAGEGWLLHLP
ncbi:O-methyltransferase [Planktotalea sp.]|uniref:O-methyltransferase n=1 Tax=Planktotalea sp. TaxID=2029877 RepID=UPI003D6A17FD